MSPGNTDVRCHETYTDRKTFDSNVTRANPSIPSEATAWGRSVSLVGLVLLAVPGYDVYSDAWLESKPLWSTLLENSLLVALGLVVVATGAWLYTREWTDARVVRIAGWCVGGTAVFSIALAWILGIQQYVQGEYKPLVIAGGAVVIGSMGTFAAGIYDSGQRESRAKLQMERDRFSTLFRNTTDDIGSVAFAEDGVTLLETNREFDRVVNHVDRVIERIGEAHGDVRGYRAVHETVARGESFEVDLQLFVDGDDREFLVLTDVTDQ